MKKNKNKTAQEPKVQEQSLLISIEGTTIPDGVAQKIVTNLQDNNLLFGHRI